MNDYLPIHKQVVSHLLHKTLPKHMYKCNEEGKYYAVIVGGHNVLRCGLQNKKAAQIVENLFSPDLDIDFVVLKDKYIPDATLSRDSLIAALAHDRELSNLSFCNGQFTIRVIIDKHMLFIAKDHEAYNSRVIRLRLQVYKGGDLVYTSIILDTSIYSKKSKKNVYDGYMKKYKNKAMTVPIPYEISMDGLKFATCEHAYYDTVRMILFYAESINKITDKERLRFIFIKFANLLVKFTALYVYINNITSIDNKHIKSMYRRVRRLLIRIDANTMFPKFIDESHKTSISKIIKQLKNVDALSDIK